ncbi:MAG: pyridine nucleotide-disulfide oxidoreductase [Bryobacterales bacterium]|nr:pyridine nucleotide-disulfide oxidoreductase [Bryobacterales bacterium]
MIIVVGAGPAGIAAARCVLECNLPVTVIDDNPAPGGQIWRGEAINLGAAQLLSGTRVVAIDGRARTVLTEGPGGPRTLHFSKLILATGSRELFLPFPGWTLPGVFGAGGIQALVKTGLHVAGKRIVVAGSGPLLLAVAALLRRRGADVRLIAEQARPAALFSFAAALLTNAAKLKEGAGFAWTLAGVPYATGAWVEAAEAEGHVRHVHLRQGNRRWVEECDYAAIGYGLVPNDELHSFAADSEHVIPVPTGDVDLATLEGAAAGYEAAGQPRPSAKLERARRFGAVLARAFALDPELRSLPKSDTFVCRCEDVTLERLCGWDSFRAAKLHTRCGMGPCQGRICGPAARFLFGWQDTSIRPPAFPVRIASLVTTTLATNGETS